MQANPVDTIKNDAVTVTKSDATVYTPPLRGIWVGGVGDLTVVTQDGSTVTFSAVAAGTLIPIAATKVMSTGTTASNITGLR